jgi:hypothetical protein
VIYAGKERDILSNNANTHKKDNPLPAPVRVVEKKIGNATFIVSSRFNEKKQKDIVSTIARLVQHDTSGKPE